MRRIGCMPVFLLLTTSIPSTWASAQDARLEWVRSYDGAYLPAFVREPNLKGPLPAIMFLHGGLGGRAQSDRPDAAYGRVQSHFFAEGYIVFQPEYRRFHFGIEEHEDVLAAYLHLRNLPDVDPEKIAVIGGSHGGYLGMMLATRVPLAALVSFAGAADVAELYAEEAPRVYEEISKEADWREKLYYRGEKAAEIMRQMDLGIIDPRSKSQFDIVDEHALYLGERFGRDRSKYEEISPVYRAQEIKAPLLFVVGTEDKFKDAGERLVKKLKALGRIAEYSLHPDMIHGFYWGIRRDADGNIPTEYYRALERTTRFVNKHVIGDERMQKRAWRPRP